MSNDDWRRSMTNSIKIQSSLNSAIDLKISDANYNVDEQIKQIEQFISDSLDIIIVSPIQSKPITPVVQKALKAGIPVLVVDRKTENQNYTAYLGADNIEVGQDAAKKIISSKTKDTIRIVEITGQKGSSPATERSIGFKQIINSVKNVTVLATIEGDWEKESIQEEFKQLLLKGEPIDYVFAHNDRMAKGAWDIARLVGVEKSINFIGVDGLNGPDGGIQLVKEGILEATILYPTGGAEAIKLAEDIINNKPIAKNNILSTTVIDQFNADIMKNQADKINEQQNYLENQIAAVKKQEELYYAQNNLLKFSLMFLIVILSLAIYSVYSIFVIRKKNRQLVINNNKITVQRNQIEKIAAEVKESNDAKLNFFTGLSHEFKTPITIILSSIESLKDIYAKKSDTASYEVDLINNNSNRLLRLVNNLLDFRKVEDKKFNLRVSKTNAFNFSKNIFREFQKEAKRRGIDFLITTNNENLELFIDRNLMDKVYFNLLSNAFKFTPDNGKIEIHINDNADESTANIHFKDNGIGIPKSELSNVFEPFFKGSNNRKNSSGVGLHLSKQFIELHLGTVDVKSIHGTEFVITLFKGDTHFNEDQVVQEAELENLAIIDSTPEMVFDESILEGEKTQTEGADRYSVLIIEDNPDLSYFLKNKLKIEYDIILSDGLDATEKAFENIPDIIICDVNLPGKTGFEICHILKQDLRTSHIPTIILTALDSKESYVSGLNSGADLYLTKPFNYSILFQSIKSLLYNRERLRVYYTNNIYKIETSDSFGNIEQEFVHKLTTLIKDNLDNADFSVESLAEELNISRVQLYRKVKAILGLSVSDYISNFKLEKAKSMLENTTMTISEIAYTNGFSSPNYFSTSFKNKFGISPVAYRKSL